jgi:hypothetical protein
MALSTLQPLRDSVHQERFPGRSLFMAPWSSRFADLAARGLAVVDADAGTVSLTEEGAVLVEAIINTEL